MSCDLATASDVAISVRGVSKKFRLFDSPKERLAEALHPLRKRYHREFWSLSDVSFDVYRGEIVGILGRNGSGKSTLLQIICSVMRQTQGTVAVNGRISALLELGAGFNPEFTGRDNVLLNSSIMGLGRQEMLRRMPDIEAFADIGAFFDQPVKTYSSGMFVRVAFAAAIHVDPDILVVDEALSVGDSKFQHRCFQRIREFMDHGKTILVVSHNADTLLRICHRGIVLDQGTLRHIGPIASAVSFYQNLLFGTSVTGERPRPGAGAPPSARPTRHDAWVDALSGDMRDKVFEHPYYNKHETRLGNGMAKIVDFDWVVDGEPNPPEMPARAAVDLVVRLSFGTALDNVSVGFALVTVDGTYVFGTNLAMMNAPLLNVEAGQGVAVRFRFTSHLAGGEYFLNIGCNRLADGQDAFVDVRRSVARITAAQTPGVVGFVDLGVSHEVIEARTSFAGAA
ncbi:ABC transporter ATP-binding protein [Trinickia caryophylli]|uniref:Lipopolysaccharide transport system ATP-binding protein n=1 Tax=Trinickia caryophylli TaxID=28094 RepID=A0A1X7CNX8_TRICW|nr:ABC transporter ATP-binding protein [Trinickia caryophylli]PMS11268.1 ABC transporter ATP-binding protein [Trinickia caryophylli]TRX20121.1 ABC transporter ATP-binding protein [Trinickia caryophylli]WQE12528.1 ABC transporter ATP-binding protein [Trinickia caryophylli]SME99967.1 lipopolysaccharide transport system ATP-binding protein [Trinickia caryophylli]GLU30213.1 sugar ABC transporter ATP-binding protein [Trinickia caryophylli]